MRRVGDNLEIVVNNLMVSYNDHGQDSAPVILFIHGYPLNKSMWNKQVEELKNSYRVIAYDVRGHGDSDPGDKDFSIQLFEKDLIDFMDALHLDKIILCGLSMGGYIALRAIENHPERFTGLILSDTQCQADTPQAKAKRIAAIQNIEEKGIKKYADESVKNLFAEESFQTRKEEILAIKEMIQNTSKQSLFKTLYAFSVRKETCSRLSEIKIPVLIIVGKEDIITPLKVARYLHANILHSTLVVIPHAGHLTNLENPQKFNSQVKKFLLEVMLR